MGEVDIAALHPIYRKCVDLTKKYNWPWHFKEDTGDFETMIEFVPIESRNNFAIAHPPESKNWDEMKLIDSIPICPDVMDFDARIVIEYEEESTPGKSSGKLGKKGHWAESKTDSRRDELYKIKKFRYCKIWESEVKIGIWMAKLFSFLADCYCNRDTSKYLEMYDE